MEIRLKDNYRWNSVQAFTGREFVKSEFRFIPPEFEAAALADERFEVRQEAVKEPVVEIPEERVVIAETVEAQFDPKKPTRKRHKKLED